MPITTITIESSPNVIEDLPNGTNMEPLYKIDKKYAIRLINEYEREGFKGLHTKNTHWSNIVQYGAEEGWWLNIPFHKFSQDLNLILNDERKSTFLHISIPANTISNPESIFRNKKGTADIFMPNSG